MDRPPPSPTPLDRLLAHYQAMPPVASLDLAIHDWGEGRLSLRAPLAANVNDKGCAFGGSLSSLMTLAAWGLVHLELEGQGVDADVFVADSRVRFLKPVFEELRVGASFDEEVARQGLAALVRAQGRASVRLQARTLLADGTTAATFVGRYVAIARG